MGIDGMRVGGGRCPPLLVAGLIVACFLLVCNWWSLSAENNELLRQIDGLSQQLKLSAEERDQCVTLRDSFEQRYKNAETKIASLHVQLGQERDAQKSLDDAASVCKIELDSLKKLDYMKNATLETLRVEKDSINVQLEERKEENVKLQDELEKVRDELSRLKLSQDATANKKPPAGESQALPRAVKPIAPQLGPVPEEAVKVSPSGQQGIMYHGIPVLPQDPPSAVRKLPRFSVTILKAAGETGLTNETQNGADQQIQEDVDAGETHLQSEETDRGLPENLEDEETGVDSIRDQSLQKHATETDVKA